MQPRDDRLERCCPAIWHPRNAGIIGEVEPGVPRATFPVTVAGNSVYASLKTWIPVCSVRKTRLSVTVEGQSEFRISRIDPVAAIVSHLVGGDRQGAGRIRAAVSASDLQLDTSRCPT
jgi:hypothetical protein